MTRPIVIWLSGTNGAGKSTLVRAIMSDYLRRDPVMSADPRKKRPMGYSCVDLEHPDRPPLFVVGHYEIANGGVDTIGDLDAAYRLARSYLNNGHDVIFEGMNTRDNLSRLQKFFSTDELRVVALDTDVEICLRSVRARGHGIPCHRIEALHRKSRLEVTVLRTAGYSVCQTSRERAVIFCRAVLERLEFLVRPGDIFVSPDPIAFSLGSELSTSAQIGVVTLAKDEHGEPIRRSLTIGRFRSASGGV